MALVLNTNSYVTVSDADTYMENRIDSANWFTASDEIKEQALITATSLIDDQKWIGYAVSPSQALAWPRKNAIYADDKLGLQVTVPEDEVPNRVKNAVYEQALHLIDNEDLLTLTKQTFESISIGSISISDSNNDVTRVPIKTSMAMRFIRPLIQKGSSGVGASWWRAN